MKAGFTEEEGKKEESQKGSVAKVNKLRAQLNFYRYAREAAEENEGRKPSV
jgi:hypothetical protein